MSRNVVAIVSSLLFVAMAAVLVLLPAPFVTWRPGAVTNVLGDGENGPLIQVEGLDTYQTTGELLMTTVSASKASARVSLPEAMIAYFAKNSDAMPRAAIYPPGRTSDQVREEQVAAMDTSRDNATVAALRAAGQQVTELPLIAAVSLQSPADGKLFPGDLVESIDGEVVTSRDDVAAVVRDREVGNPVVFKVIRDGVPQTVSVVTTADGENRPMVGVTIGVGHLFAPNIVYGIDRSVVGPSAGLVFALAIYDKITGGGLLGDSIVAGTGEIDASGQVFPIGGIRAKIAGAEQAGASVFLLPRDNCADVGDLETDLRLVPVGTLKDAIAALQTFKEGIKPMEVPSCG